MFLRNLVAIVLLFSFSSLSHAMEPAEPGLEQRGLPSQRYVDPAVYDTEVHLMWLNGKLNVDQPSLFPEALAEKHTATLAGWAKYNADLKYPITVWYSGKKTLPLALTNTQNTLHNLLENAGDVQKVVFRDIWTLPYLMKYPSAFDEQDPYFTADLTRVAVVLRGYKTPYVKNKYKNPSPEKVGTYQVYFDLNIPVVSLSSTFMDAKRTSGADLPIDIVNKHGFAFAKNNFEDECYAFENACIFLKSEHHIACQSLWFGVLEINRERGELFARNNSWATWSEERQRDECQVVFASIPQMLKYYKYLEGKYGIGRTLDVTPKTLEKRILQFKKASKVFELRGSGIIQDCYGEEDQEKEWFLPAYANKVHPRWGLLDEKGRVTSTIKKPVPVYADRFDPLMELTIQVDKPKSSFYKDTTKQAPEGIPVTNPLEQAPEESVPPTS